MVSLIRLQPISTHISVTFAMLGLSVVVCMRPPGFQLILLPKFMGRNSPDSFSFDQAYKNNSLIQLVSKVFHS